MLPMGHFDPKIVGMGPSKFVARLSPSNKSLELHSSSDINLNLEMLLKIENNRAQ